VTKEKILLCLAQNKIQNEDSRLLNTPNTLRIDKILRGKAARLPHGAALGETRRAE
jgi:hypothetical protein